MPFDPKVRGLHRKMRLPKAPAPEARAKPKPSSSAAPASPGYPPKSKFDALPPPALSGDGVQEDALGRRQAGGIADDGVGRRQAGGIADDGVGRQQAGGIADDGVGRGRNDGIADDGIGRFEQALDALVGRHDTEDSIALRNALNERLETPNFLKTEPGGESPAAQVANYVKGMGLSEAQLEQLDAILTSSPSMHTVVLLGALLEKNSEVLADKDSRGKTALENLARLAEQPLHPSAGADTGKQELMTSVLRDLINPNRIEQGDAPTCTVTSMQFELVTDEPAEYVRIMADLTGPKGRSQMRGGLSLSIESGDAGALQGRSVSNALFQTAAMEFGNGRDSQFDPYAGKSVHRRTGAEQRGLRPKQQVRVLEQLFGVKYKSEDFRTEAEGAKALEKLRGYDARDCQNRPIILQIDQGAFNHAVTLERTREGRVYFRDPYGILRCMPEESFKKYVVGISVATDLSIAS